MDTEKRYDLINDREVEIEKCPECGTPLVISHTPDGDSDYNVLASCRGCGWEASS